MNFNPFKALRRKKHDLNSIGKNNDAAGLVMPENNGKKLRGSRLRRAQVLALVEKLADIEKNPDAGQRLMQYKEVSERCTRMIDKHLGRNYLTAVGITAGGFSAFAAGLFTLNPIAGYGGLAAMGTGLGMFAMPRHKRKVLRQALAEDRDALRAIEEKTTKAIDDLVLREDLANIARSEKFNEVMVAYPALKDRFMLAAAKEKIIRDNQPQPEAAPEEKKPQGPFSS